MNSTSHAVERWFLFLVTPLVLIGCAAPSQPANPELTGGRPARILPAELGNGPSEAASSLARSACAEFVAATRPRSVRQDPVSVSQHLARADGYAMLAAQQDAALLPLRRAVRGYMQPIAVLHEAAAMTVLNSPQDVMNMTANFSDEASVLTQCRAL